MAFYAWAKENGYEDHLTLDRIDNDGDYCPSNCRWIPKQEQALNTSQTTFITHDGKTLPLTTWAKMMDLKPATLRYRINNGWSIKDALEIPAGSMKSQGPIKASIYLSYNGETKSLKEWARELNIEYTTLYNRHKIKDWSAQRTLETPVRGNRNASFANKPAHI
jgi:hypothetical protein